MFRGPLQEPRRSSPLASGLGWQRLFAGFPRRHRTLHTDHIVQVQVESGESVAKLGVDTISRVSENHATVEACRDGRTDRIQRDLRLGLKRNLLGHFRDFPPLGILGPFLRQLQAVGNRQTGTPRRHRQTHRYPTVILFPYLSTVLTCDPYRMRAFLRKAGIIHDPGHHGPLLPHRWQHLIAHCLEQGFLAPGRLGHPMVQALAHWLDVLRVQTGRHRLNALALPGQQQSLAVVLQRCVPVFVPRGVGQALDICREASLLWAWRGEA